MIKTGRNRKGWSQAELADMLDLTDATISRWETEAKRPPLRRAAALAELLELDRLAFMNALGYKVPVPRLSRLNRPKLVEALFELTQERLDILEEVAQGLLQRQRQ